MNYQDYIKYDPVNKQYTDSYGYVIDGVSSKALPAELTTAGEAIAIANAASTTAASALAVTSSGNFNTVTAGYGLNNQLTITTNNAGVATIVPTGTSSNIDVIVNPKGGDGCLKVGSNFTKHVALLANGQATVTTFYSTDASVNLTLESKGPSGKIVFSNKNTGFSQYESLEMVQANGSTTCTAASTQSGAYPNGDIKFVPRGLGIVDCKSGTMEWNRGIGSAQTLAVANNKVWFDNLIHSSFPYGFITYNVGPNLDTFTNASGRAIVLLVTGHIRETTTVAGRTLNLWIARTGDSTLQYGQVMLAGNGSDHNDLRSLNSTAIIRLAINESFSLWAYTNDTGIVIGGANSLAARPILSFRLMP
jgi:hypothetical protein